MNFERSNQLHHPAGGGNASGRGYAAGQEHRKREGFYNRSAGHPGGGNFNRNRPRPGGQQFPKPRKNKPRPPKPENKIYFIALLPTAEVGKEIIRLKQEFAGQYGARHALKVLPHITIQVPFTASPALEKAFCTGLSEFAAAQTPFEVNLNGFGAFPRNDQRVLFINVEKTGALMDIHRQLMSFLRREFGFSNMLARNAFNPHITVAFKDLTPQQFDAAWPVYEHKPFQASFKVNNLYLLRHNGSAWEVLQKCKLGPGLNG